MTIDIGSALLEAREAIRFKKNHLYRAGWEIAQQGGQDMVANSDAMRYDRMTEALETIESMWDVLVKGGGIKIQHRGQPDNAKQAQIDDLEQSRTIDIPTGYLSAFWDPKRETWRLLMHNNWTTMVETFYHPETRAMMEFETEDAAWQWYEEQP